jgi:putative glutamine amidotransferase
VTGNGRLRIGLTANLLPPDPGRRFYPPFGLWYVEESMVALFARAGALAYVLPEPVDAPGAAGPADVVADLDGLVLTGGEDVAPVTYGRAPLRPEWAGQTRRDDYELGLVRAALDGGVPVLGICRGHQLLNVARGGTLVGDLGTEVPGALEHRSQQRYHHNRHEVELVEGSALAALYPGVERATVNSVHHQAIDELGDGLVVEARCPADGVVEAVRLEGSTAGAASWAVGVQWHPEFDHAAGLDGGLPPDHLDAGPLVDEFLDAARSSRGRRHQEVRP